MCIDTRGAEDDDRDLSFVRSNKKHEPRKDEEDRIMAWLFVSIMCVAILATFLLAKVVFGQEKLSTNYYDGLWANATNTGSYIDQLEKEHKALYENANYYLKLYTDCKLRDSSGSNGTNTFNILR